MERIIAEIERKLNIIVPQIGAEASVPIKSGNLRSAIKLRRTGPLNFQVYLDEEQAPYAESVELMKPYWSRVAMSIAYDLATLGSGHREDTPDIK